MAAHSRGVGLHECFDAVWRKLSLRKGGVKPALGLPPEPSTATPSTMAEMRRALDELTIENRRLRKIVTDLLLEKMKIEEASASLPPIDTTKAVVTSGT